MIRLLIDNDGTLGSGEPPRVARNAAIFALARLSCYHEVSIFTHGGSKASTYELLMKDEISLAQFKKFVYTGAVNEWREAGKISKVYTTFDIAWGKGAGQYYEDMIEPVEKALIEIKENFDKGLLTKEQANERYAQLKPRIDEMEQFERNGVACLYNTTDTKGNQPLYDAVPGLQKKLEDFKVFFINSSAHQEPLKRLAQQYNDQISQHIEEDDLLKTKIVDLLADMDPRHSKENAAIYLESTKAADGKLNIASLGRYQGSFEEDLAPTIQEISKKGLGYKQIQLENPFVTNHMLDDSPENLAFIEAANQELNISSNNNVVDSELTTALITMRDDRIGKQCNFNDPKTNSSTTRPYLYTEQEILNELHTHSTAMRLNECVKAYEICQSLISNSNSQEKQFIDRCKQIIQNANKVSESSNHPIWLKALTEIRNLTLPKEVKNKENLNYLLDLLAGEPQQDPERLHSFINDLVKKGEKEFAIQNFRDSFIYYKIAYLFLDPVYASPKTITQFQYDVFEKMKSCYTNEHLQPLEKNPVDHSYIYQLNNQIESSGAEARLRLVQLYMDLHQNISRFAYVNQGTFGFRQGLFAKFNPNPTETDSLFTKKIVDSLIKTMTIHPNAEKSCKTKLATLLSELSAQSYKDYITKRLDLYDQEKAASITVSPTT